MKFSEDIIKGFNLEPLEEKEPVNIMQVEDMLQFMKNCAERIVQKSEQYIKTNDVEVQMDCIDLVIYMRQKEGTYKNGNSLRFCMTSFDTFGFRQTEEEKTFLRELLLRNEITHDYFNRELHQQKLIWNMVNCLFWLINIILIHQYGKDICGAGHNRTIRQLIHKQTV